MRTIRHASAARARRLHFRPNAKALCWLSTGLLLGASSCQSASQYVQRTFSRPDAAAAAQESGQSVPSEGGKSLLAAGAADNRSIEKRSADRLSIDQTLVEKSLAESSAGEKSRPETPALARSLPEKSLAEKSLTEKSLTDTSPAGKSLLDGSSGKSRLDATSDAPPATVAATARSEVPASRAADPFADPFAVASPAGKPDASLAAGSAPPFPKPEDRFEFETRTAAAPPAADPFDDSSIQQVAASVARTASDEFAPLAHKPEPRVPAVEWTSATANPFAASGDCPPSAPGGCPPCGFDARPFPSPEYIGDEFVCDGGDKGLPVRYHGSERLGLDTEDTVAEFADAEGRQRLVASNETCLYAPRFASVRSSTLPQHEHSVDKLAGHQDQSAALGLNTRLTLDEKTHADEAVAFDVRSRASGLETRLSDDNLRQAVRHNAHIKLSNSFEDYQFLSEGRFDKVSQAAIGQAIDAALEWADGRRAVIVAQDAAGHLLQARQRAEEYVGTPEKVPGTLTLVKVADKTSAHPGDTVTFTIRFDNTGDTELFGVRVIDNLSPRLAYVEGSIRSNLDGEINVTDNGAGGKLLTIEFDQPLPGRSGGYITFDCRVR